MKRDMELCRKILFAVEDSKQRINYDMAIDGYDQEEINYNAKLLYQHGLIDKVTEDLTGNLILGNLTWDGHDFLDKIREDTVWNKTKDFITQKGLPMALDVVKQVASTIIQAMTTAALNELIK